ncbi:MAG: prepilin peptidase [Kiritimatiellae bacterium]|nr:prepilin peptidase [Kiritimatiellia bacterium]
MPLILTDAFRPALSFFVFLASACIGSFLNVCIWRIPRDESIAWPGSHCPDCNHPLNVLDNIPLLSWLFLRGRCRYCHRPITPRYFIVELLTALLFTGLFLLHGPTPLFLVYVTFTGILVACTFIDLEHYILPDRFTLGSLAAGLLLSALWPPLHHAATWRASLLAAGLGAVLGGGILYLVGLFGKLIFHKDAMGLGDVKLLAAIGAILGWQSVLFVILVSSLTGTSTGLVLMLLGRRTLADRIPYGPHLALAAILWMFIGPAVVAAYWTWVVGPAL